MYITPYRTEVCTLLLCHGADPTLVNCHSKTAIDLAPSEELKQRIECEGYTAQFTFIPLYHRPFFKNPFCADEFKGHMQLECVHRGDISKLKKMLSPKLVNFQHPQAQESSLVCQAAIC